MSNDKRQRLGNGWAKRVSVPSQLGQVENDIRSLMRRSADLEKELESRNRREEELREKLLLEFIPVADAIEAFTRDVRASGAIPDRYVNELEMIGRRFARAFERSGVTRLTIRPGETPLDDTCHEVVRADLRADLTEGTITEVIKDGYSLSGRVLRPAKVVVAAER